MIMPTIDPQTVKDVNEHVKKACQHIFGDGFADHAVDLWEGTPHAGELVEAATELVVASRKIREREAIERQELSEWLKP